MATPMPTALSANTNTMPQVDCEASSATFTKDDGPQVDQPIYPPERVSSRLSRAQSRAGQSDPEKAGQSRPNDDASSSSSSPGRTMQGLRWLLVCLSLYLSCFLYGLDTTIAADVQGPVVEDFGAVAQLAWIGAGFPLGSVSVILLLGALYTSFNMKWVYVASLVLFNVGSALCGAAPNMNAMILGRVIAGSGGSGVFLGCLNYFTALTDREERGWYISLTGMAWGAGAVLGPVIGGAFSVSAATWRWAFYINLVVGALMGPIVLFYLPAYHPIKGVSIMARVKNLDFVGFILGAAMWVLFTFSFTMAGGEWPWNDGRTIAVIVVFGVVTAAYAAQQIFCVFTTLETRSFPVHLLKSRSQILLFIGTASNITSLFVVVYFIPVYFQFVHGDDPIMAAVRLLPYVAVTVFFNLLAGRLLSKIRYYMVLYVISGVFMTLGSGLLMAYLDPATPQATIYGFSVLVAVGSGLTLQTGYALSSLKVKPEDAGDALSIQNVAQIGGTVIALVLAGQIFQSTAVRNVAAVLATAGFSDQDIRDAVAGAQSAVFEQLTGELRDRAVSAITQAMQKSFILVVVAGGVQLLAGAAMKVERIFGEVVVA